MKILGFIALVIATLAGSSNRMLQKSEVEQAVMGYLHEVLGIKGVDYEASVRSVAGVGRTIPDDGVLKVVSTPEMVLKGSLLLPVQIWSDGTVDHTVLASVRIRTYGTVLRFRESAEKGQAWNSIQVERERVETTNLDDPVFDPHQIQGMRLKRMVRVGSVVTIGMFEHIPVVQQGSHVTLIVRANAVTITARAVAREDAGIGEMVLIQKAGTHERLRARVLDARTVELSVDN